MQQPTWCLWSTQAAILYSMTTGNRSRSAARSFHSRWASRRWVRQSMQVTTSRVRYASLMLAVFSMGGRPSDTKDPWRRSPPAPRVCCWCIPGRPLRQCGCCREKPTPSKAASGLMRSSPPATRSYGIGWKSLARCPRRTLISNDPNDVPLPPTPGPGTNPFSDPRWRSGPSDVSDLFLGGEPSLYLWVGVYFSGDGLASPVIQQMRVEFDHTGYLSHLPAIYRKPGACKDFLLRFLSLFETFFSQPEAAIHALPSLFDP